MVMHSTLVPTRRSVLRAAILVAACSCAAPAFAQLNDTMTPIATPDQPNAIEIGTPPLPDAKAQESWHSQYGSKFARNVTVATITPFLPDPANASGAAVVVAPGPLRPVRRQSGSSFGREARGVDPVLAMTPATSFTVRTTFAPV